METLLDVDTCVIDIRPARGLTEVEQRQLEVCLGAAFGDDELGRQYQWAGDDWCLLLKAAGEIASHVGVVDRTVTVAGAPVKVGGVGGVATLPRWQRRGLAAQLMQAAAPFMRDALHAEFGLLVCGEPRLAYYGRLGWQQVAGPLLVDQPGGQVLLPAQIMVLPLVGRPWPPGLIDLCGLPW